MDNYKEIVTKAIIGKSKKNFKDTFEVECENTPTTVLGCWIINHHFSGVENSDQVSINGSYDINVWYSYNNDSVTDVAKYTYNYNDSIKVTLKDNLDTNKEVMLSVLKQPTVSDVKIKDNKVVINVDKEMACEVVGNTKIKVPTKMIDDYEDFSEIDNIDDNYIK